MTCCARIFALNLIGSPQVTQLTELPASIERTTARLVQRLAVFAGFDRRGVLRPALADVVARTLVAVFVAMPNLSAGTSMM
jgi:hypothetical protein